MAAHDRDAVENHGLNSSATVVLIAAAQRTAVRSPCSSTIARRAVVDREMKRDDAGHDEQREMPSAA
jgi:hypothetical protein